LTGFTLDEVVPWGRSFDEYCRMFALTAADLDHTILGCGDGPAGFNAEAARRGHRVVSADPLYQFSADEIGARIAATRDRILDETRRNCDEFVWDSIRSVEELDEIRMSAMRSFLADYDRGRRDRRYVCAALPALPFPDKSFDLGLCSHLLFLYSDQLSELFHVEAALELCRVAREVRIFPLLALGSHRSPHVAPVVDRLARAECEVSIENVPYEFRRGGNQMMRIRPRPIRGPA
jgi:hypothetical protein